MDWLPVSINPCSPANLANNGTGMADMRNPRHIRIESGALRLDYRASAEQAQNVAQELAGGYSDLELRVTIDGEVNDGLPPLPCAELWE